MTQHGQTFGRFLQLGACAGLLLACDSGGDVEVVRGGAGGSVGAGGAGGMAEAGAAGATGEGGAGADGVAAGGEPGAAGAAVARFPFPTRVESSTCVLPTGADSDDVRRVYETWKSTLLTEDGAGGHLRVRRPNSSGAQVNSTVSEGIAYGMLMAVYMDDQPVFDELWKYSQLWLDANGLMNWYINAEGTAPLGTGGATDSDEDMAFALVMADRQWGGRGSLAEPYHDLALRQIDLVWQYEVEQGPPLVLKPGDQWGGASVTNPSYFAPAFYRVFAEASGNDGWLDVVTSCYDILEASLNATSGNQDNGLVPAWCTSAGVPTHNPQHFQFDSCRTPFRIGQDYCWFGEPRAKTYLEKITGFYEGVGVANIIDGYDLDGTPHPEFSVDGSRAAAFIGPAGVGAMHGTEHQAFLDQAYLDVASGELIIGSIYYNTSWTVLSTLMLDGLFGVYPEP
jgi:hypothetical protein